MRILFLSDNFPPEVNAPANRTIEHCKYWVEQGMEVTVITCAPNFPDGIVYKGYRNKLYQTSYEDGIRVIRVWSFIAANKGFLLRTIDYLSYAFTAFLAGLFIKTDMIIATSPQLFTAFSARWLAFFKKKTWIMEVRDLWPESIKAVGVMTGEEKRYKLLEKMVQGIYDSATGIVVLTEAFKRDLLAKGIATQKIKVVTNGVKKERFSSLPKDKELLNELNLNGKFVVSYIGTHGLAHKLDFILDCAAEVENPNIHFLFIGSGAEKQNLVHQKETLRLENVTFLDPIPRDKVKNYIAISDAALVTLKKSMTFRTVIPSKIFENTAMGKPILLGVEGESKEIIESYGAGLCFEPENREDFKATLLKLESDTDLYQKCKEGCAALIKDFDREELAQKMLEFIKDVKYQRILSAVN